MKVFKEMKMKLRQRYLYPVSFKNVLFSSLFRSDSYYVYRFLLHLRRYEHLIKCKTTPIMKARRFYNLIKYQSFAQKVGFVIGDGVLGEDVVFYHRGSIYINPAARVGDNCIFHGDCCIGVARTGTEGCPTIGKNVDIGVGACILGDIYIADNITIGANSVVTKSFYEPGITIAGIPARKISSNKSEMKKDD